MIVRARVSIRFWVSIRASIRASIRVRDKDNQVGHVYLHSVASKVSLVLKVYGSPFHADGMSTAGSCRVNRTTNNK